MATFRKDLQYFRFCGYGFLKNLRLFEPFLILFLLDRELSFFQIGLIYSIREITRNVFEIPAGLAADVLGRRRTMITSFSLYILSFIIYSLSRNFGMIALATIIFALGDAFRTGTHKAMIFDYLDRKGWTDQRVTYYGYTRSWSQAGSAVSAVLAALLVFYSGQIGQVFIYSVIPYAVGLILILTYPAYLDGKATHLSEVHFSKALRDTIRSFWYSFRKKKILRGILNASVYSGYYRALKDYLQPVIQAFALSLPFLTDLDENRKSAALIGIIYFILYMLSSMAARRSGRFTGLFRTLSLPLNLTMVMGFALGVLCGLAYMKTMALAAIILFIGIYMVENLRMPAGISYFTAHLDKDILATTLSAESQGKSMFTAIIALMPGFLADRLGLGTAILSSSLVMLLTVPLYLIRNGKQE